MSLFIQRSKLGRLKHAILALSKPIAETLRMGEPRLPFTLDRFDGDPTWIDTGFRDLLIAEAARTELDLISIVHVGVLSA